MVAKRLSRLFGGGLVVLLVLAGAGVSPVARAAPNAPGGAGALDPAFGGYGDEGRLLTSPFGAQAFRDAVQLPDGSVIAVGSTGADFLIVKFTPSGELDPDFGLFSGWLTVNLSAGPDAANTVALAPDGKIVVAGVANTGSAANFGVVRLHSNGTLDIPFNSGGIQAFDFNGRRDTAQALAFVGDDIIVVGSAEEPGMFCGGSCPNNIGVARLKAADGALDSNFGSGGKVQTDLIGGEFGLAVIVGNCGLYAAGGREAGFNTPPQFVIARYNASTGAPITSFGGTGVVTGTALSRVVDLTCYYPNTLLAFGDGVAGGGVGLLNFTDAGVPVSDYGSGGSALLSVSGANAVAAGALRVLPDYSTVIAYSLDQQLALARFSLEGDLVPGTVVVKDMADVGAATVRALDVALTPEVRVRAVAGLETGAGPRLALAQWFLDGTPDDGGRQALDNIRQIDQATAVAFQPDGQLLVAGSTQAGWPSSGPKVGLLARYTVEGQRDSQFGLGGIQLLEFFEDGAQGVAVQSNGQIVVLGSEFDLVRLSAAGLEDSSFGVLGWANANWAGAVSGAMAPQADGKFVLAGYRRVGGGNPTFALARFTGTGVLDDGFGAGGTVATGVGLNSGAADVAIQPDGKIVAAGLTATDAAEILTLDFALVRYLPGGGLDNNFGANGRVITDFGSGDLATQIVVLPDGKLLAAGISVNQGMALARYLSTGALDPSFGSGGKLLIQFTGNETITDLKLDGPTLLATVCDPPTGMGLVARLTLDGEFDPTFDGNGRAPFDFPGPDCPMAVAVAPGRIAAVGTTHAGIGSQAGLLTHDFAVAMYLSGRFELFLPLLNRGP